MNINIRQKLKQWFDCFNSTREFYHVTFEDADEITEALEQQQARIKELEIDGLFIKHLRKAGIINDLEIAIFKQIEKEGKL